MKQLILLALALIGMNRIVAQSSDTFRVSIIQNGTTYDLATGDQTLALKKAPFSLRFKTKEYTSEEWTSIQLAATSNANLLHYFAEGPISEENAFFTPGTGMAADGPYEHLHIGNEGHQYIFYDPLEEKKRAQLIETYSDGSILVEWTVNSFFYKEKAIDPQKLKANPVYLMIFRDLDFDKSIDGGEYVRLELHFE